MKIRRSKFLTVLFAAIPGAGHMFMGFMKRGVSLMAAFAALWMLSSGLRIGILGWIMPIVWFYAFFDCINLAWANDEDFNAQEDDYFMGGEIFDRAKGIVLGKYRPAAGIALILLGIYMVIENVILKFGFGYGIAGEIIGDVFRVIPQLAVAGLIIFIGVRLIMGKKEDLDDE